MPRTKPTKKTQAPQTPDEFLRNAKPPFRIHARPAKGEAVWSRDGRLYRTSEALAIANEELLRAIEAFANTQW